MSIEVWLRDWVDKILYGGGRLQPRLTDEERNEGLWQLGLW
jgi:hypothetical protein